MERKFEFHYAGKRVTITVTTEGNPVFMDNICEQIFSGELNKYVAVKKEQK